MIVLTIATGQKRSPILNQNRGKNLTDAVKSCDRKNAREVKTENHHRKEKKGFHTQKGETVELLSDVNYKRFLPVVK